MNLLPSLSIFTLAYNEEENVRLYVPELVSIASRITDDYEVLVITHPQPNDGTNVVLAEMARGNPRIRPVNQPPGTRGYGPAFSHGLTQIQKEFAFHTDIDGQFIYEDLFRAVDIQRNTGADLVHFNRRRRKDPWERIVIGLTYRLIVHAFYKVPVWDIDSAFNLFRSSFARRMPMAANSGVAVAEFMIRMGQMGAKIVIDQTEHQPRRAGKPLWEVNPAGLNIILPDAGIVKSNLRDIWRLRTTLRARF